MSYMSSDSEQRSAQTLTFTLPLQVPSGGAGLRCYEAFMDKPSGKLLDRKAGKVGLVDIFLRG